MRQWDENAFVADAGDGGLSIWRNARRIVPEAGGRCAYSYGGCA